MSAYSGAGSELDRAQKAFHQAEIKYHAHREIMKSIATINDSIKEEEEQLRNNRQSSAAKKPNSSKPAPQAKAKILWQDRSDGEGGAAEGAAGDSTEEGGCVIA